ncbi:MAG: hypothetical protein KDD56_08455 [Bdellovibrionales bacterium]|nr:hypothetical protein [Bdellovibrionales bacterium]
MSLKYYSNSPKPDKIDQAKEAANNLIKRIYRALDGMGEQETGYYTDEGGSTAYANASGMPNFTGALKYALEAKKVLEEYKFDGRVHNLYFSVMRWIAISAANLNEHKLFVDTLFDVCAAGIKPNDVSFCEAQAVGIKDIIREVIDHEFFKFKVEAFQGKSLIEVIGDKVASIYSSRTFEGAIANPPINQDLSLSSLVVIFGLSFEGEGLVGKTFPRTDRTGKDLNTNSLCQNCIEILDAKIKNGNDVFIATIKAAYEFAHAKNLLDIGQTNAAKKAQVIANATLLIKASSTNPMPTYNRFIFEQRSKVWLEVGTDSASFTQAISDLEKLIKFLESPSAENMDYTGSFLQRKNDLFINLKKAFLYYQIGDAMLKQYESEGGSSHKGYVIKHTIHQSSLAKMTEMLNSAERRHDVPQKILVDLTYKKVSLAFRIAKMVAHSKSLFSAGLEMLRFYNNEPTSESFFESKEKIAEVIKEMLLAVQNLRQARKENTDATTAQRIADRKVDISRTKLLVDNGVLAALKGLSNDPYLLEVDVASLWLGLGLSAVYVKRDIFAQKCEQTLIALTESNKFVHGDDKSWFSFLSAAAKIASARGDIGQCSNLLQKMIDSPYFRYAEDSLKADLYYFYAKSLLSDSLPQRAFSYFEKTLELYKLQTLNMNKEQASSQNEKVRDVLESLMRICLILKDVELNSQDQNDVVDYQGRYQEYLSLLQTSN